MRPREEVERELMKLKCYWNHNRADTDGQVAWASAVNYALGWVLFHDVHDPTDRLGASVRGDGDGLDGAERLDGPDW